MEKDLNRSQIAALKAYPIKNDWIGNQYGYWGDVNDDSRFIYREGYEQAEKDTIERAVAWLKDYVKYFELYDEKGVEEFKKAMEK